MNLTPKLEKYILDHITPEDDILNELYRKTHLEVVKPVMISGPLQGKILEMISSMIQPQYILEIGTFTGYSAICLSKGLKENGVLHTIERNDELFEIANSFINKACLQDKIIMHTGEALPIIEQFNVSFDLVFIDADKWDYLPLYNAVLPKVKQGGYILADNVLWSGKVIEDVLQSDRETQGIKVFNDFIAKDNRVEQVIFTVRDGLMLIRKK